ncbi:MAG: type IV secretory system conjugative DNA transfer family protein [Ruminococcus sp.]|nr:type IV secretory system conjugative DNA transfer family protein [Ruminococcus sp.]
MSYAYYAAGKDLSDFFLNLGDVFTDPFPSFRPADLLIGAATGGIMLLVMHFKRKNAKKYRHGEEYGSASWGTSEDIKPYVDSTDFSNNVILTQTERLTMGNPSHPKYARNKNVLVIGGSGSGKTRFFVKPNLMQMHSSYVVTDPKGTVLIECGKLLNDNKYKIKVFNTVKFSKSMHYNPFAYIHSEVDILKFVEVLIKNTSGQGEKSTEDFWVKSERLLYTAYIALMQYYPEEERNFETLLGMLEDSTASENDENYKNGMDLMFEALEKEHPGCFACKQYKQYKLAAGKTAKSILISCAARLAPFAIREILDITAYDEMQLDTIGDRKTALFIIISDTDTTFNFLVAMMYSQMFNLLCTKADNNPDGSGKLKHHVRCILDEFANIGLIPGFETLITTIRSREISASIILQSQSQLKALYKDNADTIIGNCDTTLFLGGKEKSTLKEISESLDKATIDTYNTSDTRGQNRSYGMNYQKLGRELMTAGEIQKMDGAKCILQIRGVKPFFSNKYDITRHKNYRYLLDSDKSNLFDIEKYVNRKMSVRRSTSAETYEINM